MNKIIRRVMCLITSIVILTGCSCFNKDDNNIVPITKHVNEEIFGTDVSFTMYDNNSIKKVFPSVQRYLKKLYYLLDREHYYDNTNNLATINQNYGTGQEIIVDPLLYDALKLGVRLTELTNGYFNIGVGALSDSWQYYYEMEDGELVEKNRFSKFGLVKEDPASSIINEALLCTPNVEDYDNMLVFNDETYGITFNKIDSCQERGVVLTLGALGKGYAIEKTKEYASTLTDEVFFINAGNSSIITNGMNPIKERDTWNVAIQSPYPFTKTFQNSYSFNISIKGSMAISTSADTEKYYFLSNGVDENDNELYIVDEYGIPLKRHHIINPKTGKPENYWNVITFVSSTRADVLDALTTAAYSISTIEGIESLIKVIENAYDMEIDYAIQKTKKNSLEEEYVSTFMSENIQSMVVSFKNYVILENKIEDGEE